MHRYQTVIKLGAGVLAAGIILAPGVALGAESEIGAASKVGESLGGLDSVDQPDSGSGEFTVASGDRVDDEIPEADRTVSVAVVTESDISVDTELFAGIVVNTLNDDRGWGADGSVAFELVEPDDAEVAIRLATPDTVDELCAPLNTMGYTSCRTGSDVVLNVDRWAEATEDFLEAGGSLAEYRTYLVNHEVGHFLGHGHVEECNPDGNAPVMMQQTLDLRQCEPNGWPAGA